MIPGSKEIPQFNTPEQEVSFLREHTQEQAERLHDQGENDVYEKSAQDTLRAYKELDKKDILTEELEVSQDQSEAIVLNLSTEAHDETMSELLYLLKEKGIKNTLAIVEQMQNPHIEDDFHRFLVQYLQEAHEVPGLKEKSPIFKGLSMKLYEVLLPSSKDKDSESFWGLVLESQTKRMKT